MGPFGDKLRRERERKGITLDEIAMATKINTRMLRALEEEQFDLLPGGIFNKGFVRAYARQVGLDEDEAVSGYVDASGEQPEQKLKPVEQARIQETRAEAEHRVSRSFESFPWESIPWQKLAAVLGLVIFALTLWHFHSRKRESQNEMAAAATSSAAVPAVKETNSPEHTLERTQLERAKRTAEEKQAEAKRAEEARRAAAPNPVFSAPAPGTFAVDIRAQDECWIEAVADGKKVMEEVLTPPALRSLAAHKELIVKVGNAGALDLWFNGKKLPPQGADEEVKILAFNANGLEPTPAKLPDVFSPPTEGSATQP
jgi:cytoskeleton protein RodZ